MRRDLAIRFVFGAGIGAAAAIAGMIAGIKVGGILLGFPAILPASLTLIEKKDGRHQARVDAAGAVLGSFALMMFAIVAAWGLASLPAAIALVLAGVAWLLVGLGLYVFAVRLPRRRNKPAVKAKPTST